MKIKFANKIYSFRGLFLWTIIFIVCFSISSCNDVTSNQSPDTVAVFHKNISQENYKSSEEKDDNVAGNLNLKGTKEKSSVHSKDSNEANENIDYVDKNKDNKVELNIAKEEVVQSSFGSDDEPDKNRDNKETLVSAAGFAFSDAVSQNAGIANELNDPTQIVVTLVDSATADLQHRAELSSSQSETKETEEPYNATNIKSALVGEENSTQSILEEHQKKRDAVETVVESAVKVEAAKENLTEEIPSFSEWSQRRLEEAEKNREEVNSSVQNPNLNGRNSSNLKVRSKNYASPDCGAKIVAANPEAISPSSVLSPSRDEYKLNTCTSRVWFIVELCEAIQAKKIDLANFELFSSSPKDFSVSVSDRFPSRDWSNVGHFTAKDERDVQSYDLHPHLFGKYIKVEMHSHHGSEHFCPISLFRVYGTSEFEVLEKEDQPHNADDDDDDETLDSESGQSPKNLFSSATDAVISIVKKAAEVLGNKGNSSTNHGKDTKDVATYSTLINSCTTPSHIVVCDNCSDILFGKVFELLSCQAKQLSNLLRVRIIKDTIYNSDICLEYGLNLLRKKEPLSYPLFVKSFFPQRFIAAMCNTAAIMENKVVLNVSKQVNVSEFLNSNVKEATTTTPVIEDAITNEALVTQTDLSSPSSASTISFEATYDKEEDMKDKIDPPLIKPTKTLTQEGSIEVTDSPVLKQNGDQVSMKIQDDNLATKQEDQYEIGTGSGGNEGIGDVDNVGNKAGGTEGDSTGEIDQVHTPTTTGEKDANSSGEHLDLDNLISDFESNSNNVNQATPTPPKESVFLRLSNRIKTLERNMSLSTQYLEELSRRYKKQVEEIQRLLGTMNEENKKHDEHVARLEAKINQLTDVVSTLVAENNSSFNPFHWIVLIVVTTVGVFTFCRRSEPRRPDFPPPIGGVVEVQRRKSIDVVSHHSPERKRERRPSGEALKISGTYEHLLVDEMDTRRKNKDANRKRKRKLRELRRSNSITTLNNEHHEWNEFRPKATSSQVFPISNYGRERADAPVVLEESDNNPLQEMPLPKPLREKHVASKDVKPIKPVRKISSPAFLKAVESRKKAPNSHLEPLERGHKKSASVDETKRKPSPAPSGSNVSLGSAQDNRNNENVKKDKKSGLKKIFKKVF